MKNKYRYIPKFQKGGEKRTSQTVYDIYKRSLNNPVIEPGTAFTGPQGLNTLPEISVPDEIIQPQLEVSSPVNYTGNSIVDFLKASNQGFSIEERRALGKKYGINNVGTSQGNMALLRALRGQNQSTLGPVPVRRAPQAPRNIPSSSPNPYGFNEQTQTSNFSGRNWNAAPAPEKQSSSAKIPQFNFKRVMGTSTSPEPTWTLAEEEQLKKMRAKQDSIQKAGDNSTDIWRTQRRISQLESIKEDDMKESLNNSQSVEDHLDLL